MGVRCQSLARLYRQLAMLGKDGYRPPPSSSSAQCAVSEAWELMKPTWKHSVCDELDYKFPLEALRRGFLLEQESTKSSSNVLSL